MAILMNNATPDRYTSSIPISFPNGDWCIAIAIKIENNTGGTRQTLLSCRSNNGAWNILLNRASYYENPGKCCCELWDGSAAQITLVSSSQVTAGAWVLGVLQRTGTTKQLWVGSFGNVPTLQASSTATLAAVTNTDPLRIAWRADWDWPMHGSLAFFAKGNFALDAAQMYALARGESPPQVTTRWTDYLPLSAPAATLKQMIGTGVFTPTGSPAMATSPFGT